MDRFMRANLLFGLCHPWFFDGAYCGFVLSDLRFGQLSQVVVDDPPNSILAPAWREPLSGNRFIRILPRSRPQTGLRNLDALLLVLKNLNALPFLPMVPTSTPLSSAAGL